MARIKNARALIGRSGPRAESQSGTGERHSARWLRSEPMRIDCDNVQNFDDTETTYALWGKPREGLHSFCTFKGSKLRLSFFLEYQELELGREKYMAACQYADQALRLNDLCDPYTALISRGTISNT